MHVTQLDIQNFRSFSYAQIVFGPNVNLLLGANASGKTSVLEAIAFFAYGRSLRARQDKEAIAFDQIEARLRVQVARASGTADLTMKLTHQGKQVAVNRVAKKSLSDFLGHLYVVTFTPDDLEIVKAGPEDRRRFVNVSMAQYIPDYMTQLGAYNRLLAERNQLLKTKQLQTLDLWDEHLAQAGSLLVNARRQFCEQLRSRFDAQYRTLTPLAEQVDLEYRTDGSGVTPQEISRSLHLALTKSRTQDTQRGFTSVGPHRDDLLLTLAGRVASRFGSQGQQRSMVLALKLAVVDMIRAHTGEWPVILLDDVLSELDPNRQAALLSLLSQTQSVITSTHWPELPVQQTTQIFRVSHGILQSVSSPH